MSETIEELIAECSNVYTREQYDADFKRVTVRICEKHGIAYHEVPALISEHRYTHDAEDIEQEYIEITAFAQHAGWPTAPVCPHCLQRFSSPDHLCAANHENYCAIRTTRDGWDADCSCTRGRP